MWQRFTERARRAVFFAQEEAGRLGANEVATEHLLLGLVRENDSVAARILDRMGVSRERIRSQTESQVTQAPSHFRQDMQLSADGKRAFELVYDEARQLSNNYIGTEHLLLGLIREREGLAGRALAKLNVDLERTRRETMLLQDNDRGVSSKRVAPNEVDKQFAQEYDRLPANQRAALITEGIALNALPESMQECLKSLFERSNEERHIILYPEAILRVSVKQETLGKLRRTVLTSYIVTTQATCLTNFIVKDL